MDDTRICIGAFAGAHGVNGDAKVKTFTAEPQTIADYGVVTSEDGQQQFSLKLIRMLKPEIALVRVPQITSREQAAALAGTRLYVPRTVLAAPDPDEFYYFDLVGLAVKTTTGESAGTIASVHNFGAGDIIEINNIPGHKGSHLVPFNFDAIPGVDIKGGQVTLNPDYLPDSDDDKRDPEQS